MSQYLRSPIVLLLIALVIGLAALVWWPSRELKIALAADKRAVVEKGRAIYAEYCASCHGVDLEGQPNWRERDAEGYLPAPPHDASGQHMAPRGQAVVRPHQVWPRCHFGRQEIPKHACRPTRVFSTTARSLLFSPTSNRAGRKKRRPGITKSTRREGQNDHETNDRRLNP